MAKINIRHKKSDIFAECVKCLAQSAERKQCPHWPPCWPAPCEPMSYALVTSRNDSLTPSHTWLRLFD